MWLYQQLFTYSFVDKNLGPFQIIVIETKAALNISAHISLGAHRRICFKSESKGEAAGSERVCTHLYTIFSSEMTALIDMLPNGVWEFPFPYIFLSLRSEFKNWHKVQTYCAFNIKHVS